MDLEEIYREIAVALRRSEHRADKAEKELADLRARHQELVELLVVQGQLAAGHRRILDKAGDHAVRAVRPKVYLRQYVDKYSMTGVDIDCQARMHLCHARCCSFTLELTQQDLDEGRVLWEITNPYKIRHEADDYCSHLDRQSGNCGIHQWRPASCRGFDCRHDLRIWIDFEKGIPAPMPEGLASPLPAGGPG